MQKLFVLILAILVGFYIYNCVCKPENFYIPANIVGSGDFHIEQPGAIADQGSFTNDMASYIQGHGQI